VSGVGESTPAVASPRHATRLHNSPSVCTSHIKDSSKKSAKLIKGAKEIYYPGRPHGLTATHQDEVNTDLMKFSEVCPTSSQGSLSSCARQIAFLRRSAGREEVKSAVVIHENSVVAAITKEGAAEFF